METVKDEFGNVWFEPQPICSVLSGEQFKALFTGYPTLAVHIATDRVYAGGQDEQSLHRGILKKGLVPSLFQLEPGPLSDTP